MNITENIDLSVLKSNQLNHNDQTLLSYRDAINSALRNQMQRDKSVFIYGIDVADHTATFGSGRGLLEEFGNHRVFSTPLSEDAMTGFGLGAALNGLRPIHVHMRVDFLILAMNQLINMISSYRYGSGGTYKVPIVIRAIIGRGWGQSYQHSKSIQSVFAHFPGLKVVMPSTPADAYSMMMQSICDDNPVLIIEHRWLYDVVGKLYEPGMEPQLTEPRVLRNGTDLTIVATSWMCVESIKAAEILEKRGISIEVIDARSITPFYDDQIMQSVKKTKYCIVADNDWSYCGFSAEITSRIYEKCLSELKAPIERIGFAHTPCPCARNLENEFYPNAEKIIRAVEKLLNISETDLDQIEFYSYENKFKGPF